MIPLITFYNLKKIPIVVFFFINRLRSDIYIKRTKRLILLKFCKYIRIDVYHFTYE